MPPMNSQHMMTNLSLYDPRFTSQFINRRTFRQKGIFILPFYSFTRIAAFWVEIDVEQISNESRNLWTNPETGFYGYMHVRWRKRPVANPIPITKRNQLLFYWVGEQHSTKIETLVSIRNLGLLAGLTQLDVDMYLEGPRVSDFSFGMQQEGLYTVTVTHVQYDPFYWTVLGIPEPRQNLPLIDDVINDDPSSYQDLVPSGRLPDPPYNGADDFGESEPPEEPPFEELPEGLYTLVWSTSWTIIATQTPQTTGNQPGQAPTLTGPVQNVSGPVFDDDQRAISHNVVDFVGNRSVLTFFGSAVPEEWEVQKSNYQWGIQPFPE